MKVDFRVLRKLRVDFGPLIVSALEDDDVTEVIVNPDGSVWVERRGRMARVGKVSPVAFAQAMNTVAATLRATLNRDNPVLEGELPLNGERFLGLTEPVSTGPSCVIRKHSSAVHRLSEWVAQGGLSDGERERLRQAVADRRNIVVAGGTGSGKTTFANALLACVGELDGEGTRVVCIEDTRELQPPVPNALMLRSSIAVSMDMLLRAALRARPDRIIVGEVRGGEAFTMLKAWLTGHPGGICTIHADSAANAALRLRQMCSEAAVSEQLVGETVAAAVDLCVFLKREGPRRFVKEIGKCG